MTTTTQTKSKYLDRFKHLAAEGKQTYQLIGDNLLVELIKEPEKKIGSIVIATDSRYKDNLGKDRPHLVTVLAVGEGYYDEVTKQPVPLDTKPGDIILVGPYSVKYFSFFGDMQGYEPDQIGITKEAETQMRFRGEDGYRQAFALLNQLIKKQVEGDGSQ